MWRCQVGSAEGADGTGFSPGGIEPAVVTVAEAAEYLSVSDRTIRQMISDGRLTAYRNGRNLVRLYLNEIDATMTPVRR